jgi:hypothetical protein
MQPADRIRLLLSLLVVATVFGLAFGLWGNWPWLRGEHLRARGSTGPEGGRVFRLSKWYLDCVAADGTAVVAYWARLSWGVVRLRYAATLVRRGGAVAEAATLRPGREPRPEPGGIAWRCGPLGTAGHWQALGPPVCRSLLTSDAGNVEWLCLLPRARGRVVLADGVSVEGLGYGERLDLTLRPWQLPIRELRWGRFLSDGAAVVWIAWQGPRPLALLLVNGSDVDGAEVGDAGVAWRTGRLDLEPGSVLREGALGTTALARVPLLTVLAPRAVREMHESKRLRRGRLVGCDGRVETGWAIDEVVRFAGDGG